METIVAAAITGVLTLVGVVLTVRASRTASTAQHVEQTSLLSVLLDKVDDNRKVADDNFSQLSERVGELATSHETLFGLVAELDMKVTKPTKRKTEPKVLTSMEGMYVNDL